EFQIRCNSELLGKYGNLVNRVLVFVHNKCQGKVPTTLALEPIDETFLKELRALVGQIAEAYEQFRLRRACQLIMEIAQLGNGYFDAKKPWQDAKSEATRARMETTLVCCLECLMALALTSFPIIPETATQVWKMLGFSEPLDKASWKAIAE